MNAYMFLSTIKIYSEGTTRERERANFNQLNYIKVMHIALWRELVRYLITCRKQKKYVLRSTLFISS